MNERTTDGATEQRCRNFGKFAAFVTAARSTSVSLNLTLPSNAPLLLRPPQRVTRRATDVSLARRRLGCREREAEKGASRSQESMNGSIAWLHVA